MKYLISICLIIITAASIWTSWTLHYTHQRLISEHEANVKSYGIIAIKALDERNLAEAHVAYLQKEIARFHKSSWKETKREVKK